MIWATTAPNELFATQRCGGTEGYGLVRCTAHILGPPCTMYRLTKGLWYRCQQGDGIADKLLVIFWRWNHADWGLIVPGRALRQIWMCLAGEDSSRSTGRDGH